MAQTSMSTANLASKLQHELILSPPVTTNGRSSPQEHNVDCNATVKGEGMFELLKAINFHFDFMFCYYNMIFLFPFIFDFINDLLSRNIII